MLKLLVHALFAILLFANSAFATDLKIERATNKRYTIRNTPTEIGFILLNDNILPAKMYTSTICIRDQNDKVVYEETIEGQNLQPGERDTVVAETKWMPDVTGVFRLQFEVDFPGHQYSKQQSFGNDKCQVRGVRCNRTAGC